MLIGIVILIATIGWFLSKPTTTNYCIAPLEREKVIFAYYDGCPACAAMKPIMKKRNDVYWLNILDSKCKNMIVELNLNIQAVPTFICTTNRSIQIIGARSEDEINSWIERNC